MKRIVEITQSGKTIIGRCQIATSFWSRFWGLMWRPGLDPDAAIMFPHCNSIHTFFMRFPIDVVFLDRHGQITELVSNLKPWRVLLPRLAARHVLELSCNKINALVLRVGGRIQIDGVF